MSGWVEYLAFKHLNTENLSAVGVARVPRSNGMLLADRPDGLT